MKALRGGVGVEARSRTIVWRATTSPIESGPTHTACTSIAFMFETGVDRFGGSLIKQRYVILVDRNLTLDDFRVGKGFQPGFMDFGAGVKN